MNKVRKLFVRMSRLSEGQSMTEYALIVSAIAVACIVAYNTMGTDLNTLVGSINTVLGTAAG